MAITAVGATVAAVAGISAGVAGATFATAVAVASIAFSVATLAMNLLFPKKGPDTEGARLGDLQITSSTFGQVRPICYGTVRLAGNIIWALPITEVKTTEHHGKGGGKGANSTTYTYFGTYALALCEGTVEKVLRIWADNKIVYDATASDSQLIRTEGFNFRFYPGNDSQLPDSIIEADKGVGNVPAYRGTCYLVFDNIPLLNYGNRLPNLTVEITMIAEPAYLYEELTLLDSTIFGNLAPMSITIDPVRDIGYAQGLDPNGLVIFDTLTMQVIREAPMTEILADGTDGGLDPSWLNFGSTNLYEAPDGALYFSVNQGGWNTSRLVRVDQNTLRETATFPNHNLFGDSTSSFAWSRYIGSISYFDATGRHDLLVVLGFYGDWGVLFLPSMTYGGHGSVPGYGRAVATGNIALGVGDAWLLSMASIFLFWNDRIFISRARYGEPDFSGSPSGVVVTLMFTLNASDLDPAAALFGTTPGSFSYDQTDDTLLFQCETVTSGLTGLHTYLIKWSPVSGIIYATQMPAGQSGGWNTVQSWIQGSTYAKFGVGSVSMIDAATGTVLLDQGLGPGGTEWQINNGIGLTQVYDSRNQILYAYVNDGSRTFLAKVKLGRFGGTGATLGGIIQDQCRRAGMADSDFDVSEVTDSITGYIISQRATVLDTLASLLAVFMVDAIEIDYVLKFKHRGGASVASLTQDELIRIASSETTAEPYTEVRQQEVELPMAASLSYIDPDRDYQINTQIAKRVRNPDPTVFSDNQADLSLAITTNATRAKQLIEVVLFNAWNERHTFNVRLPPKYSFLDPSDVVQFTVSDGYTARTRLNSTSLGLDHSLDTKLIAETDGQYVSTAVADAGTPWGPSHSIVALGPSEFILLDVPLLRDIDDAGGRAIRGYWAASTHSSAAWPGATLQESDALDTWRTLGATNDEATFGFLVTPPPETDAVFLTQYDGSLVVTVLGGHEIPASTTDLGLANGANPLALIKTNGEVEIIQYRDVTTLSTGTYQLSILRRGQRGTDTMASGHTAGETILFLSEVTIDGLLLDLSQRSVLEYFRTVTNGSSAQSALIKGFTFHSRDQMPYAPVDFRSTLSGSPPDLVVTWRRRTRIGGWQMDGVDTVPLNETSEAYEAYVIVSEGAFATFDPLDAGSYLRAFTGLTAATLTYTAAEMSVDSFDPTTDTLYLVIYQLSGIVGRGFAGFEAVPAY